MTRILLSCLVIAASHLPSVARGDEPAVGRRWALLIGVNSYVSMRSLDYCVDDMQALRDQLVACGFPEEQVYLLRDKSDDAARLPTKLNIEKRLKLLLSLVKEKDLVLVAFSGHGVQLGTKTYWCPPEADVEAADQTLVALDTVYEQLENCPAALRLVLVDACRNDPSRDKSGEKIRLDAKMLESPPEGILVFNSCGPNEKSKEDERLKHGVFTHFVLEGLRGKADNDGDRSVSLGELWEYAGEKTKKHVGDVFADFQQPRLKGELTASVMRFPITPILPIDQPGRTLTNGVGMKLALIPAGEFLMGSVAGDSDAGANEQPQHRVRITKSYYLGLTEVTQGQWESVMGTSPWSGQEYVKEGANYPATYVSWEDATEFCKKLSAKEGKKYRLPTEAEWEYACRAGTTTKYSFGDDESQLGDYAWCDKNAYNVDEKYAHLVGTKRANPWGLYDMHGNVWEWCDDWYDEEFYGRSRVDDPSGILEGSDRVLRGGSWVDSPALCRSAYRYWDSPDYRNGHLGFRVALVP